MSIALEEAERADRMNEVPIGAVLVSSDQKIIARGHNLKESSFHPLDHAEIMVLNEGGKQLRSWRLDGCTLYVTLEPCPMCMHALVHARVARLVFGAYDPKGGSLSMGYNFHNNKLMNHRFSVIGGLKHFECSKIISDFFRLKRSTIR